MADNVTLKQAIQALDAGDLKRAQRILADVLTGNPRDVRAWTLMAEAQTDLVRRQECLDRALKLDPHNEIARLLLTAEPTVEDGWKHEKPATSSEESLHVEWGGTDILEASAPPPAPTPTRPPTAPIVPAAPIRPTAPPRTAEMELFIQRARQGKPSLEVAMILYDNGEREVGIEILRKVVKRQPQDEMAWVGLIEMIEDHAERAQTAAEALKRHPNSALIRKAAGRPTGVIERLAEEPPPAEHDSRRSA